MVPLLWFLYTAKHRSTVQKLLKQRMQRSVKKRITLDEILGEWRVAPSVACVGSGISGSEGCGNYTVVPLVWFLDTLKRRLNGKNLWKQRMQRSVKKRITLDEMLRPC